MPRYIDAEKLKERLLAIRVVSDDLYGMGINRGLDRAETAIDMLPTADVAPKTEVEELLTRLTHAYEKIDIAEDEVEALEIELKTMRSAANSYKMHYEKAKTEVAREIMKKVRQTILNMVLANAMGKNYDIEKCFNEIEKKYTEGAKNE